MNRLRTTLMGLGASITGFLMVLPAQAAGFLQGGNLRQVAAGSGVPAISGTELPTVIARIIGVITSVLGIVLLGYLMYAGYLWMTAQGDDKQVQRAKDMIKNAIIGLVIIALSYAISNFVITTLSNDILSTGSGTTPVGPARTP